MTMLRPQTVRATKDRITQVPIALSLAGLMLLPAADALSQEQEYAAMEGASSADTAFDFRVADPEVAVSHLDLIHSMRDEPSMTIDGEPPEIVVVFIGPSVKLISTDENATDAGSSAAIAEKISAMDADGVRFEVCMTAAHAHDVSAESILPEIEQVRNGWVSLVGYQQNGYAMIAD